MSETTRISRRAFLVGTAALGGGLVLGFHLPVASRSAVAAQSSDQGAEVNAWIVVKPENTVVIRVARSEMGQGIFTALPMLVAEELECDWSQVRAEYVPAHEHLLRDRVYVTMATGGSRSVRQSQEFLRQAGASAREMLITAAALRWDVPASECRASSGKITHGPSGRTVSFGGVATDAARLDPPDAVTLKRPADWKLIGTPVKRLDTREKVLGKPVFGTDVQVPGMLHAALRACPVFGGKLKRFDAGAVKRYPGVHKVTALNDAVAVVAETYWQAEQALRELPVEWDEGPNARTSSDTILAGLRESLDTDDAAIVHWSGDVEAALDSAAKRVEADYYAPYLAHATMEPMNCTAHVSAGGVEVWVPTQNAEASLLAAAEAAGVAPSRVKVHNTFLGGGFGRRGAFQDFVRQAVLIAGQVDRPVKLMWSREQDMRHDFYRPVSMARFTAGLDGTGMPVAWQVRVAGHSILHGVRPGSVTEGLDPIGLQGLDRIPYGIPNQLAEYVMHNSHVPVGFWRAVNHSQNAFFKECFVDELAHVGAQDPYHFRRRLLSDSPKELAVLDAVANRAGWDKAPPEGIHRGIAVEKSYGSYCAQVAEVSVDKQGRLRVHRVVCAIDPGHVVNPDTVEAQVESGIVYGLTAALYGDITISQGRVVEGNFDDYPMLLMAEMPRVEVHPVPSQDFWGGMGEPPLPPVTPAVCNAIFAATGRRIRSLPLRHHGLA